MTWILSILWFGSLVGAYWLGWKDAKDQNEVDELLRRLDRLFEKREYMEGKP